MEWVSLHHCQYRRRMYGFAENDDQSFFDWRARQRVHIGHDVWIGHNVTVLAGVTIGNGAVIGSGAVVSKDIPPYGIAVGVPAKIMRYRFDPAIREELQRIAWWDWDHATLKERLPELRDIRSFLARYGGPIDGLQP
jgi:acetyltransferase-like isoleucine patch superfamily enzyme